MDSLQDQLQAHREAWNRLPWIVNGTADAGDEARVRAHLAQCADCREELAFQQNVQQAMASDAPAPHDAEPALRRLLGRINSEHDQPRASGGWIGRRAPIALAAVVAVQAVALAVLGDRLWGQRRGGYETLSSTPPSAATAVIRLVPSPALRLSDLRALLDRNRLRVVETSGDAAVLGLAAAPSGAVDVAATVQRLRHDPAVLLAEPVQLGAAR